MEPKTFLIEHRHTEETCPSQTDEGMRRMGELVMGRDLPGKAGVKVVGDWLALGHHRLLIFVEAPEQRDAERYAQHFRAIGPAEVSEVGRCEAVMAAAMAELPGAGAKR